MVEIRKFVHKPTKPVDAVRVTAENISDVSEWCTGEVRTIQKPGETTEEKHIKVRVHQPLTDRRTQAFIGDWVLSVGPGFKVYTNTAFRKSFEDLKDEVKHTSYRDAETGAYVSESYAEVHPNTTVGETNE